MTRASSSKYAGPFVFAASMAARSNATGQPGRTSPFVASIAKIFHAGAPAPMAFSVPLPNVNVAFPSAVRVMWFWAITEWLEPSPIAMPVAYPSIVFHSIAWGPLTSSAM